MADEIDLTELTDIEVTRQDAVAHPASGFPVLIMKAKAPVAPSHAEQLAESVPDAKGCGCCPNCSVPGVAKAVNSVGGIDEKPDIAGAEHILQQLARLISSEADEMAAGHFDEVCDIQTLCEVASMMRWFCEREMDGDEDDGAMLKAIADGDVFKAHRKFSSDERKKLASEGNALEDGSYPIPDADALRRAAILARSGHGDVAAAKKLIARRAKELGVPNPLADNDKTQKDAPVNEDVNPETPAADAAEDGNLTKEAVEKMIADAAKPYEERIEVLKAEVEKMRSTPIPGQVALTAPASARDAAATSELLSKAAYLRRQVELTDNDYETNKFYRDQLAKAEDAIAGLR